MSGHSQLEWYRGQPPLFLEVVFLFIKISILSPTRLRQSNHWRDENEL